MCLDFSILVFSRFNRLEVELEIQFWNAPPCYVTSGTEYQFFSTATGTRNERGGPYYCSSKDERDLVGFLH